MPTQLLWHVAQGGYRWIESHAWNEPAEAKHLFLTDGRPTGAAGLGVRQYQPLTASSGLFRTFAETEPTLEGIKSFADRYGLLGPDLLVRIPLYDHAGGKGVPLGLGEALRDWTNEILVMRDTIRLWESARRADVEALSRMIKWQDDGRAVAYESHPGLSLDRLPESPFYADRATIAYEGHPILEHLTPGDMIGPALQQVQGVINRRLHGRVSPRVLWQPRTGQRNLYLVPHGLIAGLWWQLARAFERDREFRRCIECGTWFEISGASGRSDKVYCSNACRTRVYRKRQVEAARLHAEGHSIEQIARQLESEAETVAGWIKRQQGSSASGQSGSG
jgi:hypothetical protein